MSDTRPLIVQAVENWNRALNLDRGTGHHPPTPHPSRAVDRRRLTAAAHRALRVYPGPAGELIHRELVAAADLGHHFDLGRRTNRGALLLRLVEQVLTAAPPLA